MRKSKAIVVSALFFILFAFSAYVGAYIVSHMPEKSAEPIQLTEIYALELCSWPTVDFSASSADLAETMKRQSVEEEGSLPENEPESEIEATPQPTQEMTADERIRVITAFLREEAGLNNAAIAGILANMDKESYFRPDSVGDYNNSYGLCQWNRRRSEKLFAYCEEHEYDWESMEAQLWFLLYELETDFNDTYVYTLQRCEDSQAGAERAAYYFCLNYEAPVALEKELEERTLLAIELYYPMLEREQREAEQAAAAAEAQTALEAAAAAETPEAPADLQTASELPATPQPRPQREQFEQ